MTKEMMNAMKAGKVKMISVSSHIKVEFPAVEDVIKKYSTVVRDLFNNNLNGSIVDNNGLRYIIISHAKENADINKILDKLVEICIEVKDNYDGDVAITINGERTDF